MGQTDASAPPRWDLSPLYSGLDDRAFTSAVEGVYADIDRLSALYDEHDIRDTAPRAVTAGDVAALDDVLAATNRVSEDLRLVSAYLHALITTDSRDDDAAARYVELQTRTAPLGPLSKRLGAWLHALGADAFISASPEAEAHAFALRKAAEGAELQMGEFEESLAAELAPSGSLAWQRLHGDVSSQLMVDIDGERIPMTLARGLATHPDPDRRRAAYEGELKAWKTVEVPLAAALNGAKGEAVVLNKRRGFADDLEPALKYNNVDRATLDAMNEAVVAALPDHRRYFRAKARALGHDNGLPWWDLFASTGHAGTVSWPDATTMVHAAFAAYSDELADLATRAFAQQWVDAEMREGKRGGAYCMSIGGTDSRVLMNFDESNESVSTLAHELGHAFHNQVLAPRTPLQRRLPMALAETASIFCETLLFESSAKQVTDDGARTAMLDTYLVGASQVVVDIHSRLILEYVLYKSRRRTIRSPAEMCDVMREAQEAAYGDGLDPEHRHEYMWAVKPHYFTAFYNWPYTYGLLFGIGLYAEFVADPDRFRAGYNDLLATTGMEDAAGLAARFGIDVRDGAFWKSSLDVITHHIDDYVQLVGG
jgi:pepF/M3 family oligoendopeptidase